MTYEIPLIKFTLIHLPSRKYLQICFPLCSTVCWLMNSWVITFHFFPGLLYCKKKNSFEYNLLSILRVLKWIVKWIEEAVRLQFKVAKTGHSDAIIYLESYISNTLLIATSGCKEPYFYFNEDIQLLFKNKIMESLKINKNTQCWQRYDKMCTLIYCW